MNRYGMLDEEVMATPTSTLSFGAKVLRTALRMYAHPSVECYPKQTELARAIGASRQTVSKLVAELVDAGLLTTREGRHGLVYRILESPSQAVKDHGQLESGEGVNDHGQLTRENQKEGVNDSIQLDHEEGVKDHGQLDQGVNDSIQLSDQAVNDWARAIGFHGLTQEGDQRES